ncbi:MAG: hypothetical protein Q7Q73_14725 [Verrucomicrobiota bacterium JB024]|nr:hypothetical protein [Verrucomicrobiota bacterium JB024]
MNPETEIVALRREVRFLSLTFKCVCSVILVLVALLIISLALKCGTYQKIYDDILGGANLPVTTAWVLDGALSIAIVTGVWTAAVLMLVFVLRALWPLALLAVSTLGFVALYLSMRDALFRPVVEIIGHLIS